MLTVSRETEERLGIFVDCLRRWNGTINLLSSLDLNQVWNRHIPDGVAIGTLLTNFPGSVADLGSGAGIPGLIASIVSGRTVTLVEADRRKAAFLVEAGRLTYASVRVVAARIEVCDLQDQAVVTARALAPLRRLLELSKPILAPRGVCLFIKGQGAAAEIATARNVYEFECDEQARHGSTVLTISELRPR